MSRFLFDQLKLLMMVSLVAAPFNALADGSSLDGRPLKKTLAAHERGIARQSAGRGAPHKTKYEMPAGWKRTMTNDPSTNYVLGKLTVPLDTRNAELLRTVLVSLIAVRYCRDVHIHHAVAEPFLGNHGYYAIRGKAWSDAQFLARYSLRYMSYRDIAHLCAGLGYLFGPKGKLAKRLLVFGQTGPRDAYDPQYGTVIIPELPQPKS